MTSVEGSRNRVSRVEGVDDVGAIPLRPRSSPVALNVKTSCCWNYFKGVLQSGIALHTKLVATPTWRTHMLPYVCSDKLDQKRQICRALFSHQDFGVVGNPAQMPRVQLRICSIPIPRSQQELALSAAGRMAQRPASPSVQVS